MSESRRYVRQMRVAEVGREKQQNLRDASVHVLGEDLSARVEALYLAGAGVGKLRVDESIAADIAMLNSEIIIEASNEKLDRAIDARVGDLEPGPAGLASGSLAALRSMKEIFAR